MPATRDRILDAAADVIRTQGFGAATTRAIAAAAGLSEGSLYNHFADKHELVSCVLAERLPTFVRFLVELPDRAGTATVAEHLEELVDLAVAFDREILPLTACSLADPQLLARHRDYLREHDRGPHLPVRIVATYLRREQDRGRVSRAANPEIVAALLLGAALERAFLEVVLGDGAPLQRDDFAHVTVRSLFDGLAPDTQEA